MLEGLIAVLIVAHCAVLAALLRVCYLLNRPWNINIHNEPAPEEDEPWKRKT